MFGCLHCGGIGFVYSARDGREHVRRCACDSERSTDPIDGCRIPGSHAHDTLGNFAPHDHCREMAYEQALAYCAKFTSTCKDQGLGLLFWGPKGSGKTHLAVGVLRELVANAGVTGRYWEFGGLVKNLLHSYDRRAQMVAANTLEAAMAVELLLLDELGSRRIPDWADDALFELFDARYRARRPTLITTAFEDAARGAVLWASASRRDEFLVERIGQRTRSRLLEMCLFVPMQERRQSAPSGYASRPSTLAGMRRRG